MRLFIKTDTMRIKTLLFTFLFSYSAVSQSNDTISNSGTSWVPSALTINVGDTVTWVNTGGTHNVNGTTTTFPNNPESFGNSIAAGWTYQHVFTIAGNYDFQCDPHASMGMTGTITVQDPSLIQGNNIIDPEVYPNPFYNNLTIKNCNGYQLIIYSIIGKLEFSEIILNDNHQLSTAQLPEGIYLYEILYDNKKIKSGKLVKH